MDPAGHDGSSSSRQLFFGHHRFLPMRNQVAKTDAYGDMVGGQRADPLWGNCARVGGACAVARYGPTLSSLAETVTTFVDPHRGALPYTVRAGFGYHTFGRCGKLPVERMDDLHYRWTIPVTTLYYNTTLVFTLSSASRATCGRKRAGSLFVEFSMR